MTEANSRSESNTLHTFNDAALVVALRQDVPGAASVLWRRYISLVRGVLRRTIRSHYDVDDLAQEVFLRVFQRISALRDPAALRGFLSGIAVHVAQDEMRRRRRYFELLGDTVAMNDERVADTSIQARLGLWRLHDVLARMRPDVRRTFVLREFEQLEIEEIARTLGCSMATVKRMLVRARTIVETAASQDPMLARYI